MERRDFLRMAAAAAALVAAPRTSRAATARVDVLVNEPIGPITADFYGHFVEHLGGVVYDGVWVGEGSKIPNTNGIRQALIDAMRKLPKGAIRPRPAVLSMAPYSPPTGGRAGKLRLDFNENTVGCSPRVIDALKNGLDAAALAVYPEYDSARETIANYFRVRPEAATRAAKQDAGVDQFLPADGGVPADQDGREREHSRAPDRRSEQLSQHRRDASAQHEPEG